MIKIIVAARGLHDSIPRYKALENNNIMCKRAFVSCTSRAVEWKKNVKSFCLLHWKQNMKKLWNCFLYLFVCFIWRNLLSKFGFDPSSGSELNSVTITFIWLSLNYLHLTEILNEGLGSDWFKFESTGQKLRCFQLSGNNYSAANLALYFSKRHSITNR